MKKTLAIIVCILLVNNLFAQGFLEKDSLTDNAYNMSLSREDEELFMKFVSNNLQYPRIALEYGIQGKVALNFTIDEAGKLKEVKVGKCVFNYEEGYDPAKTALKNEAIRIVKKYNKWRISYMDGKAAERTFWVPFTFQMN